MNEYLYNQPYNPASQLAPQGFFGGMVGAPLGGLIGRGIGGLFGSAGTGSQIGQLAGGIGGALLPFGADPIAAAYAQQQQAQALQQAQLAPQGWIGNLIGTIGQPLGGAIGGLFGQSGIGNTIGGAAGQLGRLLPFGTDPASTAYAQQQQLQQQLQQQQLQQQQLQQQLQQHFQQQQQLQQLQQHLQQQQQLQPQFQQQQQPQQAQQAQMAPQGWFGNLIGSVGQPLGGAIGGLFGQGGIGSAIGGAAGQLGRMLPFGADPMAAFQQQAQQQALQQAQQQALQQALQQAQQQIPQQAQLAPQGWFGNLVGQYAQPAGSAIGGLFGQSGLGGTIGNIAGQFGRMLPFAADPISAAYAQQQAQQFAAQQAQQIAAQQAQQQAQMAQQQAQQQLANSIAGGYPGGYQNVQNYAGQTTLH